MSLNVAGSVGGVTFDDSDILLFEPTSLGSTTAGTFSLYFDGSDVGLTTNGEDIDVVALAANGDIIISTRGGISANGASGADEDLWIFSGTLGANTSGSFTRLFDGSDVGLGGNGSADINAGVLTGSGDLLFSTVGNISVGGLTANDEDVNQFSGTFGNTTSGTLSPVLDLSALGISTSEDVGGLFIFE